jgi:hypothetical protein
MQLGMIGLGRMGGCYRPCDMNSADTSNPTRMAEMESQARHADPFVLVIFGSSGDLTRRLLIQAVSS